MTNREFVEKIANEKEEIAIEISRKIWELAELSHEERNSSQLLIQTLEDEGFTVERNVCGAETAFVASFGTGKPVIGLLGEYDALPNLSQQAGVTKKIACEGKSAGHGCGHNLIGAGALLAALIIKRYLEEQDMEGTVKYYGCAGEENIGVKPLMARDGYFKDTDCVFAWHPEMYTGIPNLRHYAVKLFNVSFSGKTSHAGSAPELGRSALDACELMNVGCNYLREHVTADARIHYAYLDAGGAACNIVPDHAKLCYGVRSLKIDNVNEIIRRIENVAKGAAMMTDTTVTFEPVFGYSDFFQNAAISEIATEAMIEIGATEWSQKDYGMAAEYRSNYDADLEKNLDESVRSRYSENQWEEKKKYPLDTAVTGFVRGSQPYINAGSTDVGDVAYVTPTTYMFVATSCLASPAHSWYWTSAAGSEIGQKGMVTAGKILALSAIKAFESPEKLKEAREEWMNVTRGEYQCPM